jgi:hypothetical protein
MSEFSTYLENKIIDVTLRGGAAYTVAAPFIALFESDPLDNGTGTECSWTGYMRQEGQFLSPTNGVTQNLTEVIFPPIVGATVQVTHIAVYDAEVGGNLMYHTALDVPATLNASDTASLMAGQMTIILD